MHLAVSVIQKEEIIREVKDREQFSLDFLKHRSSTKQKKIDIAKGMLDKINTNYLESEVLRLLSTITEYKVEAMDAFPKVFYSGKIDGVFYEVPVTLNDMSTRMHTFLYPTKRIHLLRQFSRSVLRKAQ